MAVFVAIGVYYYQTRIALPELDRASATSQMIAEMPQIGKGSLQRCASCSPMESWAT